MGGCHREANSRELATGGRRRGVRYKTWRERSQFRGRLKWLLSVELDPVFERARFMKRTQSSRSLHRRAGRGSWRPRMIGWLARRLALPGSFRSFSNWCVTKSCHPGGHSRLDLAEIRPEGPAVMRSTRTMRGSRSFLSTRTSGHWSESWARRASASR